MKKGNLKIIQRSTQHFDKKNNVHKWLEGYLT